MTSDSFVEIRGDVKSGDRIVRRGHGGLADGMVVVVRGVSRPPVVATAGEITERANVQKGSDS